MKPVHFVSISGGKDSTATACVAIERAQRRSMDLRFIFADTGNEHEITLQHIDYLASALGISIETVRADFSDKFEARRQAMLADWPNERRRRRHTTECRKLANASIEQVDLIAKGECGCPIKISPALPQDLIDRAVALMIPTGVPFLDMAMLHGRFPGSKSRFCTDELKLIPMQEVKDRVRLAGDPICEWIGERADESDARAKKPPIEIERCVIRAPAILYRPIHSWKAPDVFAIAKRHGLKPNPLYLMGMSRVGCMPCIMCQKGELREIARRFPEHIDRLEEWERIVGGVARHAYSALVTGERTELVSSFLPADKLPPDKRGHARATIRNAVEWSRTGRGGRNYDMLIDLNEVEEDEAPSRCSSRYGLCE